MASEVSKDDSVNSICHVTNLNDGQQLEAWTGNFSVLHCRGTITSFPGEEPFSFPEHHSHCGLSNSRHLFLATAATPLNTATPHNLPQQSPYALPDITVTPLLPTLSFSKSSFCSICCLPGSPPDTDTLHVFLCVIPDRILSMEYSVLCNS